MKKIIKDNKWYVIIVAIFLLFTIGYKIYKWNNTDYIDKEVVNLVLPTSEMTNTLRELVDKFNLESKDIHINYTNYELDYINIAITKLVNQREIDIFEYFDRFLVDKDQIANLDSLDIDYSKIDNGATVKLNNDVVGIKYGSSIPKMIINKDILKKAGIENFNGINTFEELIDIANKIKENVPGVTPIGISTSSVGDNFMMVGTPSAMNSNIYSTFWNYSEGKYTFNEATETLEMYRNLYNNGLINKDFDTKISTNVLKDFTDGKVAITFNQYYNKKILVENSKDMNISIEDIPVFNSENLNKRYYYPYNKILVIRNYDKDIDLLSDVEKEKVEDHKKAVKKVYEWLMSEEVTGQLIKNDSSFVSFDKNIYNDVELSEFNEDTNFEHEILDPSIFISVNKYLIRNTFSELIKGSDDIESRLKELEESINREVKEDMENSKVNLDMYKE